MARGTRAEATKAGAKTTPETRAPAGTETTPEAGAPAGSTGKDQRGERPASASSGPLAEIRPASASCLTNAHYHAAREAFLDTAHRWLMLGVIVFGAGAVVDLAPHAAGASSSAWLKSGFAAIAALFGALDLTFDLCNRARAHAIMKRRYFELWADLRGDRKTLVECQDCLDRFNADEEPPFRALLMACRNRAELEAYGPEAYHFNIWVGWRFIKNFLRLPSVDFGKPTPIKSVPTARGFRAHLRNWWFGAFSSSESVAPSV